jgi:hypothetical protein
VEPCRAGRRGGHPRSGGGHLPLDGRPLAGRRRHPPLDFAVKAARALDLYDRLWDGRPLGEDEYALCADEKSQLQALSRRHPDLPPAPGRDRRQEFEYRRGGTLAYLAAYDVHAARVIGRCAPTTGIEPFAQLVEQVMTTEPYASASRVFWIVDNGSSHNGARSIERMRSAWPTAELVHLPIHASWLNQHLWPWRPRVPR